MAATRQLLSPLGPALALVAAAVFAGGGAAGGSLPWVGGAAVVVALVFVFVYGVPSSALAWVPLAVLAGWCLASVAWSAQPDRSWEYGNRALVYVAFAFVGVYVAGRTRELAVGLAAVLGALCVYALAAKALPWLYGDYGRVARLRAPIGYWNALALLGDVALPVGLWLAGRRSELGTLLVYGWIVALGLTYSRGGVAVAVVVVAAWVVLTGTWVSATATVVAAGIPAAGVLAAAFALHGVTSDGQPHAARVHDGVAFGSAVLVGAIIAVMLALLPRPEPTRAFKFAAGGLAVVVAAIALGVAAAHAHTWWKEFRSPATPELTNAQSRFVQAGSNHRWVWWQEAWHGFVHHPFAGTGAGTFGLTNLRYRTSVVDSATEPHDLPVQFLSETGVVGLVLLAAALLVPIALARRRSDAEVALALALPAYVLHSLLDIDWDFLAVTGPVLLVAGALLGTAAPRRRFSPAAGLVGGGVALAVLASLVAVWLGNRWSGDAASALASPHRALTLAKRARQVDPLLVDPLHTEALAYEELGQLTLARDALLEATAEQPLNPDVWFNLGEFDLRSLPCARHALTEFERFYELDSQDPGVSEKDVALRRVNSGVPRC
ncbi:MAG: O-antigen ligase family protein [Actinobacteria bacterium]|nr:O-antigen ligase family protein [Actinomycetota bacterium]